MIGTWVPARYSVSAPPRRASADGDPPPPQGVRRCQLSAAGRPCAPVRCPRGGLPSARLGSPVPAVGQEKQCVCSKPPPRPRFDRLPAGDNFSGDPGVRSAPPQVKAGSRAPTASALPSQACRGRCAGPSRAPAVCVRPGASVAALQFGSHWDPPAVGPNGEALALSSRLKRNPCGWS